MLNEIPALEAAVTYLDVLLFNAFDPNGIAIDATFGALEVLLRIELVVEVAAAGVFAFEMEVVTDVIIETSFSSIAELAQELATTGGDGIIDVIEFDSLAITSGEVSM